MCTIGSSPFLPRLSVRTHPYIPSTALEQPNPIPYQGRRSGAPDPQIDNYL